MQKAKQAS
jgi:hypothetical protein